MLIAEVGNNHEGLFSNALRLIDLAAPHCDAVKFQIFRAERLVHPDLPARVGGGTQLDRLKSLEFSDDQWHDLRRHCEEQGVEFMATCFDVQTLKEWAPHLKRIKISSGDNTYEPLIEAAAATGKPVIVSTGGADRWSLCRIRQIIRPFSLTFLHCVSRYPCTRPGLGWIRDLQEIHDRVGYSCHTPGIEACYAAAVMGALVIEKHFTDERRTYGDHQHSALPQELKELRRRLTELRQLMESDNQPVDYTLKRGTYAARAIRKGESITEESVVWLRPDSGRIALPSVAERDYQPFEAVHG